MTFDTPYTVALARPSHARRLAEIEAASFPADLAWDEARFKRVIRSTHTVLVASLLRRQVGYLAAATSKDGDLFVLSLAVDPAERRQGVASYLLAEAASLLPAARLVAKVPEPALGGQLFFKARGFLCTDIFHFSEDHVYYVFERPA